jgi:hypothetical protein
MIEEVRIEYEGGDSSSHLDPHSAAWAIRKRISIRGFEGFCVAFGDREIEWTDPDLILEKEDLRIFRAQQVPLSFVRVLFLNWEKYRNVTQKSKPGKRS